MKKRLLSLAAFALAFVSSSFGFEVGEYGFTATQRFKVTGDNIVQNGNFISGTEGWTDAEGNALNADVWSMEEGIGPNGENALMSINGSTDNAALCRAWALDPGTYVVKYDIKGETAIATGIMATKANCIDIYLSTAANLTKAEGDVNVSGVAGIRDEWRTVSYLFYAEEGQSLAMHIEKLTANVAITNIEIYPAQEVYDIRALQSKLDYVKTLEESGAFVNDYTSESGTSFLEVVGAIREWVANNDPMLEDISQVNDMLSEYDALLLGFLNVNSADVLKDEKRWDTYTDTRKMNEFGNWKGGYNKRWFHKNNGGSNEITNDGDEIGYRFQGGFAPSRERIAYSLKPSFAGTYMFSIDVVGHYMCGTSGSAQNFVPGNGNTDNYITDWNRDFKGVTVYAGNEEMAADDTDAEKNVGQPAQKVDCGVISNPNAHNNPQKFVVFYEVSQEQVDNGETIYFGIAYAPDPDVTGKYGCNVNIANPQIRVIGHTQDELDYLNEVQKIIVQQGPLKDRLTWAADDIAKTAQDGFPWGKAALQEKIDWYTPVYEASLEVVDIDGNVKNEELIRQFMDDYNMGVGILYSDSLLRSVQAMNSARSTYTSTNNPIASYRQKIADAEAVRDDAMNSLGDKATFQAVIDATLAKLNEVLAVTNDETRDADIETLNAQLALLDQAVEAFKQSAALVPFIDIDFANNFEEILDEEGNATGAYTIKGAKGQMDFEAGIVDVEDNTGAPNEKGVGNMMYAKGHGEELLDVLRIGKGAATVNVPEGTQIGDDEIVRFDFNVWFVQLSGGAIKVELLNADNQRLAGFGYCAYGNPVDADNFNTFNNEANEGLDFGGYATSNRAGDVASHVDGNKNAISLIIDYKAKAVQGIITTTKGTCTGAYLPLQTYIDEENSIEDTKVAKFVLTSSYGNNGGGNYVGRRCWFDDLKAFKYPSPVEGPIENGVKSIDTKAADSNAIYTISGVRVAKADKAGLYIKNGKVIVVK